MDAPARPSPLSPRLENLASITAEDLLLAYLAASKTKSSQLAKASKALSVYIEPEIASQALDQLSARAWVSVSARSRCALTDAGRDAASRRFGPKLDQGWTALNEIIFPALALGLDIHSLRLTDYLSKRENLESLILGRAYGVAAMGDTPERTSVRYHLLRRLLSERFPECAASFAQARPDGFKPDPLSQALLLGLAGVAQGSLREAESMLALCAAGARPGENIELPEAVVRAALSRSSHRVGAVVKSENGAQSARQALSAFAQMVRQLAQTMETLPFSGRVAIAEVYDAGTVRGLAFGSLEEFKARVAEACRAGLIDLERYDIAGVLDTTVRDRSRTQFGRDERHFIVNEWA